MATFHIPIEVMRQADAEQEQKWREIEKSMAPVYDTDPRLPLALAIRAEINRLEKVWAD